MSENRVKASVIIPALDEEEAISRVVRDFCLLRDSTADVQLDEVVVVDNGSRDRTRIRAEEAGAIVVYAPCKGYGSACLEGLSYLRTRPDGPPDMVVFADGDGSNDANELPELVAPINDDSADMVIGSRILKGDPNGLTFPQKWGNRLAGWLLYILYGAKTSDLGPYRAVRWSTLESLNMEDADFGWTVEMQAKAASQKLRVVEVDVSNYRRIAGKSKVSGTVYGVFAAGTKIIWTIYLHRPR